MPQTIASTPTTESTAIIQKSIACTPSKLSLAIGCNEDVTHRGEPRKTGLCSNLHGAEGSNAAHLRSRTGGGARRDGGARRGRPTERGTRRKRALRGLGGRLRLRWLSARGGCDREKRGGDHGLGFVGVGALAGASDGHPWVPLRREGLGSGAGARRPRRIDDGVCGVVALR